MSQKPLELVLRGLLREHGTDFLFHAKSLLDDVDLHKWYLSERLGKDVGYEAAISDWAARYGRFENPEILKIECEYKSGMYLALEEKLSVFISKNKGLVDNLRDRFSVDVMTALKLLLLQKKSIDARAEIGMQVAEIKREAWYRASEDYDAIAAEWAKLHAAGWREHYTLVLGYILEVRKERFLQLL
jgi:hypothetical protein